MVSFKLTILFRGFSSTPASVGSIFFREKRYLLHQSHPPCIHFTPHIFASADRKLLDNFHSNSSHKPAHKHKNNCFTILAEVKVLTYLRFSLFIY